MVAPFILHYPLILASGSPRRRAFLEGLGIPFEVHPARCAEPRPVDGEDPLQYALRTAESKASFVASRLDGRKQGYAVLAADTVVILRDGNTSSILGKPGSRKDAVQMLSRLVGRTHEVVTACCIAADDKRECFYEMTEVTFAHWPLSILEAYADSGDPLDKAGAYGIQDGGAFLVQSIRGSWSNVVGLPLDTVLKKLVQTGILEFRSS